ncbi:unnamed protein product, partial [Ectocarpus sp. 4 AP-2014]
MHAAGVRLSGLLSVGLGLDPSFFESCTSEMADALRLLHYSAEVRTALVGVMGAGAHSGYGLLTLLATDDVPMLQVRLNGEWLDVPPREGAFICNLGDMLQRWRVVTNDELLSTVHRVVNKLGRERYSVPFFFELNFDTMICILSRHMPLCAGVACFPQCCSEENPAKYPPVSAGRYTLQKYSQTQQDFDCNQQNDEKLP